MGYGRPISPLQRFTGSWFFLLTPGIEMWVAVERELQRELHIRRGVVAEIEVAEPPAGVRVGKLLVFRGDSRQCVGEVGGGPLQDQGIEVLGVFGGHGLGESAPERMSHADDLGKGASTDLAAPRFLHEEVQDFHLKRELDDLGAVWMVRPSRTESIVGESGVPGGGRGIHIAVPRGNVPVGMVQGTAMGQNLERCHFVGRGLVQRQAEFGVDAIRARHEIGAADRGGGEFAVRLSRFDVELRDCRIVGWRRYQDLGIVRGRGNGDGSTDTVSVSAGGIVCPIVQESGEVAGVKGQLDRETA